MEKEIAYLKDESLKLDNQLCFPLYSAARKVINFYTPLFKPLGITYTQYIVFMALWENNEMSVGELCSRLYLDSGTLTPLLKNMEKEGYLTRKRSIKDERVVIITITEKGLDMKKKVQEIPFEVSKEVGANISPEEAAQLKELLDKIIK